VPPSCYTARPARQWSGGPRSSRALRRAALIAGLILIPGVCLLYASVNSGAHPANPTNPTDPANPTNPAEPVVAQTQPAPTTDAQSEIVYITRTGSKYHRAGCRYLSKSKIPISLKEAKQHYSPCSVCNPPR
jgi:hypothetical protein